MNSFFNTVQSLSGAPINRQIFLADQPIKNVKIGSDIFENR